MHDIHSSTLEIESLPIEIIAMEMVVEHTRGSKMSLPSILRNTQQMHGIHPFEIESLPIEIMAMEGLVKKSLSRQLKFCVVVGYLTQRNGLEDEMMQHSYFTMHQQIPTTPYQHILYLTYKTTFITKWGIFKHEYMLGPSHFCHPNRSLHMNQFTLTLI